MMARVDDTAHFCGQELKRNSLFKFALTTTMAWSKNIHEKRNSPEQILLGSMNTLYCVLLGLAVYLEVSFAAGFGLHHPFLFVHTDNANKNKKYISDVLCQIWNGPAFIKVKDRKIGTHSLRKYPATQARQSGCSQDEMDTRGRWKKGRVSDVYVLTTLPYPDAKVAAILCPGRPCKYKAAEGLGLSDPWLLENVMPAMAASDKIDNKVALTLSLPLLWASMNAATDDIMPAGLKNRMKEAYASIGPATFGPEENPVENILVIVTGLNAELHIDEAMVVSGEDGEDGTNGNTVGTGAQREDCATATLIRALSSRVAGSDR